jgi:acyl carrier protein
MNREEIKERVFLGIEEIVWDDVDRNEDLELRKDIGFDSLDCVEFLMHVERDFKISIPDEEAEPVKTVKEVIDIIEQKVK